MAKRKALTSDLHCTFDAQSLRHAIEHTLEWGCQVLSGQERIRGMGSKNGCSDTEKIAIRG